MYFATVLTTFSGNYQQIVIKLSHFTCLYGEDVWAYRALFIKVALPLPEVKFYLQASYTLIFEAVVVKGSKVSSQIEKMEGSTIIFF